MIKNTGYLSGFAKGPAGSENSILSQRDDGCDVTPFETLTQHKIFNFMYCIQIF